MNYEIIKTSAGWSVYETRPVLVGAFTEHDVAEKVVAFLEADAAENGGNEAPLTQEALSAEADITSPAPAKTNMVATPKPEPDWTEEELEAALVRVAAGEKLKDVATEMGRSWTVLRGKLGARRKQNAAKSKKVEPTEQVELEECRLCGKAFRPSPDRMELCAGCDDG